MSIIFSLNIESGYFISKYIGNVSMDEVIDSYSTFFENGGWKPGMNELVDHSELDGTSLRGDSLNLIAVYAKSFYEKHNISNVKTAIFAPVDLPYGLSRIYEVMTYESPEKVRVFREMKEAKLWLGT